MGQSGLARHPVRLRAPSEGALKALAGTIARGWRGQGSGPLLVGLRGELGAGKTTWVRGMLEGLGYAGRVPSPTYTLLEHYWLAGLDVVHLDLYRLGGTAADADARGELEALGLRDWLARPRCWVLAEWPERSADLLAACDLIIALEPDASQEGRRIVCSAQSDAGTVLLDSLQELSESASS